MAHCRPGCPPASLKFAFFHYPLYSDQQAQSSDTYLQGAGSLEGLLASNDVSIAFNGHAHIYERNVATGAGTFPSYVTGGGGATLQPVAEQPCHTFDAYAIGWSPTKLKGSSCGAAAPPASADHVFHYLLVTVSGTNVTVTPTDEYGRTFDVVTYAVSGGALRPSGRPRCRPGQARPRRSCTAIRCSSPESCHG